MLNLNDPQVLAQLMSQTNQKWRNCKRKQYNIFACKMPKDIVFANKLEQPDSFNAMKKVLGKYISTVDECRQHTDLMQVLNQCGCYKTDGECITLCGTAGELWAVKEEKLKSAYTNVNGTAITKIPKGWFTVSRAAEQTAQAMGIYIPSQYVGVYKTGWGQVLQVNNPNSDGHNMGDILVAPLVNGQPNLADCSPTNNTVFARTYDLNIGGWGSLGIKANSAKPFTIEDCKKVYAVPKVVDIMHSFQKGLDALHEKHNMVKLNCEYYDLDEMGIVWFMPDDSSRKRFLYNGFYCGVMKTEGGEMYVLFRNLLEESYDFDIKVEPTTNAVLRCIHSTLGKCQSAYKDYQKLFKSIKDLCGNANASTTGEEMDDGHSIFDDGIYEGRYLGLDWSILSRIEATDIEVDAYMAIQLEYEKPNGGAPYHYNVWIQGEKADEASQKLGKNLQCRGSNYSETFSQVSAMINALRSL